MTTIAINAWLLRKKELDGIGIFTKEIFSRLIRDNPDINFLVLCDKNFDADYFNFPNARIFKIFPPFRHPLLYILYHETTLVRFLKKNKVDLLIAPDGLLSLSSHTKQISCIHDLNYMHQPKDLDLKNRLYYRTFLKFFAKKATRIVTVSHYSKKDIIETFSIDEKKIDVVYLGIKNNFHRTTDEDKIATRQKYTGGKEYFLFVGTLHPRKNIVRLIKAFDLFVEQSGSDKQLVIVGNFMWNNEQIINTYNSINNKSAIHITGRLSEEELNYIYNAAYAMVFISTFEGFGLPIVESFEVGIPLITSNVTSMPEVAGDAAILVDPFNVQDICDAMILLDKNTDNICQTLVEKGYKQKQKYSWDETSRRMLKTIEKVIGASTLL